MAACIIRKCNLRTTKNIKKLKTCGYSQTSISSFCSSMVSSFWTSTTSCFRNSPDCRSRANCFFRLAVWLFWLFSQRNIRRCRNVLNTSCKVGCVSWWCIGLEKLTYHVLFDDRRLFDYLSNQQYLGQSWIVEEYLVDLNFGDSHSVYLMLLTEVMLTWNYFVLN